VIETARAAERTLHNTAIWGRVEQNCGTLRESKSLLYEISVELSRNKY
jgi:hypothetical protein